MITAYKLHRVIKSRIVKGKEKGNDHVRSEKKRNEMKWNENNHWGRPCTWSSQCPQCELSEKISQDHSNPRLDILQRQVFSNSATVSAESRSFVEDADEDGENGIHRGVDVEFQVPRTNLRRQILTSE